MKAIPLFLARSLAAIALLAVGVPAAHAAGSDPCKQLPDTSISAKAARDCLNPGYSLLYQEASELPKVHWILLFKNESKPVSELVTATLDYYDKLTGQLEQIAKDNPAVIIDLNPMPDIIGRARAAQGEDQFKRMRPLVGETGTPFERDLLLLMRDTLDEQRHIVGVLQEDETDASLKRFLQDTHQELDKLYGRYNALLDQRYFVHFAAPSK